MASLLAHLAHVVDTVKVLIYMGRYGQLLSSVLACLGHPYVKLVFLHLPLCLLLAPHRAVYHMDKARNSQTSRVVVKYEALVGAHT